MLKGDLFALKDGGGWKRGDRSLQRESSPNVSNGDSAAEARSAPWLRYAKAFLEEISVAHQS